MCVAYKVFVATFAQFLTIDSLDSMQLQKVVFCMLFCANLLWIRDMHYSVLQSSTFFSWGFISPPDLH